MIINGVNIISYAYIYRIQTCCNHIFISCRGVSGAEDNMRGSRNFCQFYLVLSLFYNLQRGSNSFIAEKTILILYQGSRRSIIFQGGGVQLFPEGGGPNANFNRNPYTSLLFSRGVSGPPVLLWIRTWAMSS